MQPGKVLLLRNFLAILDIHTQTLTFLGLLCAGAERTLSGSKYPEESCARGGKPRHKCHKQLSADLEQAFSNSDFSDVKVLQFYYCPAVS